MNKFRLNSKNLSLTYPQCSISKTEALKFLSAKLGDNLKEYLIVQEVHEDGNLHLHCYLELNKRVDYNSATCLDMLDCHGNYQSTKKKESWIEYLLKSDKEPLQSMDFKEYLSNAKNHKKTQQNIDFLNSCLTLGPQKMVQEGMISVNNYQKVKSNLEAYLKDTIEDQRLEVDSLIETPWNINLRYEPDNKQSHYWIYSKKSNYGKTTFALELMKKYLAELWNSEEKYQPQIKKETQMIIFDEYSKKTCLTIGQMNQIMDGTVYITGKGMNAWKLNGKPIVLIFSNFPPSEVYSMTPNLPNLMARINVINLEDHHTGFN
jgi:hypothetical protein